MAGQIQGGNVGTLALFRGYRLPTFKPNVLLELAYYCSLVFDNMIFVCYSKLMKFLSFRCSKH